MPSLPGVYFFEDEDREPLYIGKSINLRSRLRQHFDGYKNKNSKAFIFIPKTKTLFLKVLDNDIQAIITESNYIKTHKPRYNSVTKDDKSNTYLVFTNPPDTKLQITHGSDIGTFHLDNYQKQVFGPYSSGKVAQDLVKICRRTFGVCLNPFNNRFKACFNFHLHRCPGACTGQVDYARYQIHLGKIKKFLSGSFKELQKDLNQEIKKQIKNKDFESAQRTKIQIESLQNTISVRSISNYLKLSDSNPTIQNQIVQTLGHHLLTKTPQRIECFDLAHLQTSNYVGAMSVFINGEKSPENYRHFNILSPDFSDPHAMKQIIKRRLNHSEWGMPDLIVLDGGVPQLSIVSEVIPNEIPTIALAKKKETIFFFDQNKKVISVNLPLEDPVLNLFRSLRDEAHRLANSFHRQKRRSVK